MAQLVSEVSKLVKKCNQLSNENLELRQEQENHATAIRERDAQISELNGMIQILRRGAASCLDSERRLALENATLLDSNQNQSLELKERVKKIHQLQAELKKARLDGIEVKGQLTSLRSKVTAAYERIQQLETENAQLKADLNVARQEYEPSAFNSEHPPQLEEEEEEEYDDDDDEEDEEEEENEVNSHTDTTAGEVRRQVTGNDTEAGERVKSNDVLYVKTYGQIFYTSYGLVVKVSDIIRQCDEHNKEHFGWCPHGYRY
ncbi:tropomyosin [Lingula anatina]|uniref:Tropomyosin n=1 Tax=Lingula anatina TaxID=7574 RepID=A0A1S3JBE5_LINAN|nr:tropomyosin [Lingula anatina]|eukprot:XP_013407722.1 tropomyosin [Lingula anatina]